MYAFTHYVRVYVCKEGVRMWVSMYVCLSMHVCKYVMHLYKHACIAWMQTCKHIPVYTHSHMLTSHNIYICTHKWIHKGTRVGPHKYTYTYNTEHSKQVVCIHRGLCLHYRGCSIRPLCVNVVNVFLRWPNLTLDCHRCVIRPTTMIERVQWRQNDDLRRPNAIRRLRAGRQSDWQKSRQIARQTGRHAYWQKDW